VEWSELDALADELRRTLARGALPSTAKLDSDPRRALTAQQLAQITLADVDHLHSLESTHAVNMSSLDRRRDELAADIQCLLDPAQ
jgi:hypothetical protein